MSRFPLPADVSVRISSRRHLLVFLTLPQLPLLPYVTCFIKHFSLSFSKHSLLLSSLLFLYQVPMVTGGYISTCYSASSPVMATLSKISLQDLNLTTPFPLLHRQFSLSKVRTYQCPHQEIQKSLRTNLFCSLELGKVFPFEDCLFPPINDRLAKTQRALSLYYHTDSFHFHNG